MKPSTTAHVSLTCDNCSNQFFYAFRENQEVTEVRCDNCGATNNMRYTTPADIGKRYGVTISVTRIDERPDGLWDDRFGEQKHYKVRIGKGRRSFGMYFSTGIGWAYAPELKDVLDCLASDAAGYENAQSFEDWASEYGYDTDSRKAERIYRTVKRQAEQLKRTIGEEAYNDLLWNTERL